jgi:6-phosphogluconolactonase
MSFVYVSNAEDGDIGLYTLERDGTLEPRSRFKAGKALGPLSVSPDKRFLAAAVRAQPYVVHVFSIDRRNGSLKAIGAGPLAESFPYITFDRTGRWLLGASYGGHLVSVNPVDADGAVGEPLEAIPTARHAHAIITDRTNRFVFVPHLGTDQVFQFVLDAKSGRLSPNSPPHVKVPAGSGPRHLVTSPDNRFVYLLNELTATVTVFSLEEDGTLRQLSSASALPPDSRLRPGMPRPQEGRDVSNDVWASDIHVTPDGRFLYAAERTTSTINAMRVDGDRLHYAFSVQTEKQPRGFRIDPSGRHMVVSGERSGHLAVYSIEPSNGALTPAGRFPTGRGSNWVEIVSFG